MIFKFSLVLMAAAISVSAFAGPRPIFTARESLNISDMRYDYDLSCEIYSDRVHSVRKRYPGQDPNVVSTVDAKLTPEQVKGIDAGSSLLGKLQSAPLVTSYVGTDAVREFRGNLGPRESVTLDAMKNGRREAIESESARDLVDLIQSICR